MLTELLKTHHTTLSLDELISFVGEPVNCISVKSPKGYCYTNANFVQLMGQQSPTRVIGHTDTDLTNNKQLLKHIQWLDTQVLEGEKPLVVSEVIHPLNKPHLSKRVNGTLHPVFSEKTNKPCFILGLFTPVTQLLCLDLSNLFKLNFADLGQLLSKASYSVNWQNRSIQLSRREIEVIIGTVRGWHAGEIAGRLILKQTTIEFYLQNIKNKLGINTKSELIQTVLETNLLAQILL